MTIVLQPASPSTGYTFLGLCQFVREQADMNGTGPVTTVGQEGEMGLVVRWVRQAWLDIQVKHKRWNFMRKRFSFQTEANKGEYTLLEMGAADLRELDMDSMRSYRTATGVADEQRLIEWDWQSWYDTYSFGLQTPSRPVISAVNPADRSLALGALPDGIYTVKGWYWTRAVELVADGDRPNIPDELHLVIAYRALLKYANFDAAPEVKQAALEEYKRMMYALERDWLPAFELAGPIA